MNKQAHESESEKTSGHTGFSDHGNQQKSGFANFWQELKRRKVMRVAITYAVVAWLIMQVAGLTFDGFGVPVWAFRFVVIALWLFFPVAILLACAFELTPAGIKTTKAAQAEPGNAPVSGQQERKRNWSRLLFSSAVPPTTLKVLQPLEDLHSLALSWFQNPL